MKELLIYSDEFFKKRANEKINYIIPSSAVISFSLAFTLPMAYIIYMESASITESILIKYASLAVLDIFCFILFTVMSIALFFGVYLILAISNYTVNKTKDFKKTLEIAGYGFVFYALLVLISFIMGYGLNIESIYVDVLLSVLFIGMATFTWAKGIQHIHKLPFNKSLVPAVITGLALFTLDIALIFLQ